MATRSTKSTTIILGVCQVQRSKNDLRSLIEEQIKKGNDILSQYPAMYTDPYGRPLMTPSDLEKFTAIYTSWQEYCEEIYTSSFSDPNTKYLAQFQNVGTPLGPLSGYEGAYSMTRDLFRKQINQLESFNQRLDLIYPI